MRTLLVPLAFTLAAIATSVGATPPATLADRCDASERAACEQLATITRGQCASPQFLGGCRFDSTAYSLIIH